eukprot:1157263-Pelagomonas_calceolata.AAC.2
MQVATQVLCRFAKRAPAAKLQYAAALSTSLVLKEDLAYIPSGKGKGKHIMQTRPFLESEDETRPRLGAWPQFEQNTPTLLTGQVVAPEPTAEVSNEKLMPSGHIYP